MLKELDLVRAARAKELEDLNRLRQTGAASSQDVLRWQAAEADARVGMLERRNEVIRQAGGAVLLDLNRELLGAAVAAGELDGRIKSTSASLAKLAGSAAWSEQLEVQQHRWDRPGTRRGFGPRPVAWRRSCERCSPTDPASMWSERRVQAIYAFFFRPEM